ncbi:MAG: nuclear transport factor 2 family protein [Chloroflexota bacterium]
MNTEEFIDRFIRALDELERTKDSKPIGDLFSDDAVLYNPMLTGGVRGREGVERFWQQYRGTFKDVKSLFRRRLACGNVGVLEWYSDGHLSDTGMPVHYSGVSIFEHDGQRIRQFNVYYDSVHLMHPSVMVPAQSRQASKVKRPELGHGHETRAT